MKLYRCFIGILLVFFITIAVLYIGTMYNERRSIDEGILVFHYEDVPSFILLENQYGFLKGGADIVISHSLC